MGTVMTPLKCQDITTKSKVKATLCERAPGLLASMSLTTFQFHLLVVLKPPRAYSIRHLWYALFAQNFPNEQMSALFLTIKTNRRKIRNSGRRIELGNLVITCFFFTKCEELSCTFIFWLLPKENTTKT